MRATGVKTSSKVYALTLNKASGDEARLVLDNGAALVPLDLVHPLQADRTTSWRWIDELPSLVFPDRLHLLQHCSLPICIALGQRERGWFLCTDEKQLWVIEQPTRQA